MSTAKNNNNSGLTKEDGKILRDIFIAESLLRRAGEQRLAIVDDESNGRTEIVAQVLKRFASSSSSSSASTSASRGVLVPHSPSSDRSNQQQQHHDSSYNRQRVKLVGSQLVICNDPQESNIARPGSSLSTSPSKSRKPNAAGGSKEDNHAHLISPEDAELFRGQATTEDGLRLQFDALDRNRNGFLEKAEFKYFFVEELEHFGLKPTDAQFEEKWKKNCGTDAKLNFKEFALFMLKCANM